MVPSSFSASPNSRKSYASDSEVTTDWHPVCHRLHAYEMNDKKDGTYRKLDIKMSNKDLKAQARKGYYAIKLERAN
jgi:hypothetical protein